MQTTGKTIDVRLPRTSMSPPGYRPSEIFPEFASAVERIRFFRLLGNKECARSGAG